MENLPNEVLHEICSYLEPWDVKEFRWLSRSCAAVGLEYLIPVIHIALLDESIEKLHAIAEHPVLRHRVHTVLFEPNVLESRFKFQDFQREYLDRKLRIPRCQVPRRPPSNSPARDVRRWKMEVRRLLKPFIPAKQMRERWKAYQHAYQRQSQLHSQFTGSFCLQFMAKLPRLRCIRYHDNLDFWQPPAVKFNHFDRYMQLPCKMYLETDDSRPFRALLQGAFEAGSALNSLWMGDVFWGMLIAIVDNKQPFAKSMHKLNELQMALRLCGHSDCEHESRLAASIWRQATLDENVLGKFLSCSPDLESLGLRFQLLSLSGDYGNVDGMHMPGRIDSVMHCFVWHNLRKLSLVGFTSKEKTLTQFLEAHAKTLKHLELGDMHLEGVTSSWTIVFQSIGVNLDNLVSFETLGSFTGDDFGAYWDAGYPNGVNMRDFAWSLEDIILRPIAEYNSRLPIDTKNRDRRALWIKLKELDIFSTMEMWRGERVDDIGSLDEYGVDDEEGG